MDLLHLSLLQILSIISTIKSVKPIESSGESEHTYKVNLATKKGKQTHYPAVNPNTGGDFKQLVKTSQLFIDNSLLIEGIIDECTLQSKYLRICVPSKWGKTTNMRMLQAFFEIQVHENGTVIEPIENTSNYKLFRTGEIVLDNNSIEYLNKPLLIAQNEPFCRQHQGQYPVMYLPFKNISGDSVEKVRQSVCDFIQHLYTEFKYITIPMIEHQNRIKIDSYVKFKLDRFNQTLYGNITDHAFALDFLSQVLSEHFVKKVVIIMDDYSAPSIAARKNLQLDEDEIHEIDQLLNDLTYKLTHNFSYNRLIIIIDSQDVQLPTFENFWDNNITARDLPWFKHFGFNQNDVAALFENRTVPQELLKLPASSYETKAQDVSMVTMERYLNRDDIQNILLQ